MRPWNALHAMLFVVSVATLACAGPAGSNPRTGDEGSGLAQVTPARTVRITGAINSAPPTLSRSNVTAGSGSYQGGDGLEDLANAGLTHSDPGGQKHPQLAEVIPTVENGLWKLLPDGRMETTWKLRPNATWHDGTPLTAADLIFTAQLSQDRELPVFRGSEYNAIESLEAPDPRSLVIKWKQPYVRADEVFLTTRPKHVLEPAYLESKASVLSHSYWTDAYVGAGPYRLRTWVADSHAVFEAFDSYVLGRPRIEGITVKFIPDPKALVVNVLAGEVDFTMGRNISVQQAMEVREQWKGGSVGIAYENWIALYPQFIDPNPRILLNVQFRRALLHGLDRQNIVDVLQYGLSPVAHTFLFPGTTVYRDIESAIVRYDYDPRRAAQLLEQAGLTKGADGLYRDSSGQPVPLDVRTSAGDDTHESGVLVVADQLRTLGIATEPFMIPQSRRSDLEYNQTFPGIRLWRKDNTVWAPERWHSRQTPLPETRFVGSNDSRYMSPDLDNLIDRYVSTIPQGERSQLLGQIVNHITSNLAMLGLWYNTEPHVVSHRLKGRAMKTTAGVNDVWNVHEWHAE